MSSSSVAVPLLEVLVPGNPTSKDDNERIILGEGAFWDVDNQRLLFVDILGKRVHIYSPTSSSSSSSSSSPSSGPSKPSHIIIDVAGYIGTVVPTNRPELLLIALQNGIHSLHIHTREVIPFGIHPETSLPHNRFNDGKCDPAGRLWAGTMGYRELAEDKNGGALYKIDGDATVTKMLDKVTISNGICWSIDGKHMYYIDTPTLGVDQFDFDVKTGTISNRTTLFKIPPGMGSPDGMTIDSDGHLWIAMWNGKCVTQWDVASGKCLRTIPISVSFVSSVAFGGPHLTDLYITTAAANTVATADFAQEPLAGSVFVMKNVGSRGVKQPQFRITPHLQTQTQTNTGGMRPA